MGKWIMDVKRKVVIVITISLFMVNFTIPIILALKRVPPYANAKVEKYKFPDPPWFAEAEVKAKALPGYGYACVFTTPMARASTACAEVEFNAYPVPGNSPVLDCFFHITGSTTIHVKGTVGSQGTLAARLNVRFQIYDYRQGKWVPDPYKYGLKRLGEGVYNKTYKISKSFDYSNNHSDVDKYTITSFAKASAQCIGGATCEAVVDFYTGEYPERVVFVCSIELCY